MADIIPIRKKCARCNKPVQGRWHKYLSFCSYSCALDYFRK